MLTLELKLKFLNLAYKLSPENISCDGELSSAEVRQRYRTYAKQWHDLEKQAGCTIQDEEKPFEWIEELRTAKLLNY